MNARSTSVDRRPSQPEPGDARSGRRIPVRVLSVLGLVALGFLLVFVLTDAAGRVGQPLLLEPAGSPEAQHGADHPGEVVHLVVAAGSLVIAGSGLVGLAIRPGHAAFAVQSAAAVLAWVLASLVAGNPDNTGGQAGPFDPAFLLLAAPALAAVLLAAPWRAWRRSERSATRGAQAGDGGGGRPRFLLLAAAGVPWLTFAVSQGLLQRGTWPPLADPHHQAHWFAASLLGFMIVLVVAGAALPGRGWRVATFAAGAASLALAVASLSAPAAASALPTAWAGAAALWGSAVLWHTVQPQRRKASGVLLGGGHRA